MVSVWSFSDQLHRYSQPRQNSVIQKRFCNVQRNESRRPVAEMHFEKWSANNSLSDFPLSVWHSKRNGIEIVAMLFQIIQCLFDRVPPFRRCHADPAFLLTLGVAYTLNASC